MDSDSEGDIFLTQSSFNYQDVSYDTEEALDVGLDLAIGGESGALQASLPEQDSVRDDPPSPKVELLDAYIICLISLMMSCALLLPK